MLRAPLNRFGFVLPILAILAAGAWSFAQPPSPKSAEHEILKDLAGTWDAVVTFEGAPGAKAVSVQTLECDGLWIATDFKMEDGSFSGRGLDGYDPAKKKWISVWVDSMITAPLIFEGDFDSRKKTLTMEAKSVGPDGQPATLKSVTSHVDDDHLNFEMFMVGDGGQENRMMRIEYTRRKAR